MSSKRKMTCVGAIFAGMMLPALALAMPLKVGQRAPVFTLPDQNGRPVDLANYLGRKNVVLAFYVLAFTAG